MNVSDAHFNSSADLMDVSNVTISFDSFNSTSGHYRRGKSEFYNIKLFTYVFQGLLIVVGLIGNLFSILVWTKGRQCSTIPFSTYFILLAFSDVVTLINSDLLYLIQDFMGVEIILRNIELCIFYYFFMYSAPSLSIWLVVCITIERVLTLSFPFTFPPSDARNRAKIAFIIIVLLLVGINSHAFVLEMKHYGYESFCFPRYFQFYKVMHEISVFWTLCAVPFLIVIACNILILLKFYTRRRNSLTNHTRDRVATFTSLCIASGMLQTLSIFPTILEYLVNLQYLDNKTFPDWKTMLYISRNTLYLNNCCNCLVYCFSSFMFRSDLKIILRCNENR